jgi:hypothetical protein
LESEENKVLLDWASDGKIADERGKRVGCERERERERKCSFAQWNRNKDMKKVS